MFTLKPSIVFVLLLFCSCHLTAQIRLRNISLTKPDSSILYLEVDNKLVFDIPVDPKAITIKSTKSKIVLSDSILIVAADYLGNDTITVYQGKKQILQQVFMVADLCPGKVKVSNTYDTVISKEQLLAFPTLSIGAPGCLFKPKYYIIDFFVTFYHNGKIVYKYLNTSDKINASGIEQIMMLERGDKIVFEGVRCGCPRCKLVSFGDRFVIIH